MDLQYIYMYMCFVLSCLFQIKVYGSTGFTSWILDPSADTVLLEVLGITHSEDIGDCLVWCNSINRSRFLSYDNDQNAKTCRAYASNVSLIPTVLESTEKFYTRVIASSASICTDIGYRYNETLNFCYQLNTDGKSQNEANQRCNQDDARLAVLDTEGKAEFIKPVVKTLINQLSGLSFVRVGGTYQNNTWVWSNGKHVPMADHFWNYGEPNNPTHEPCLTVDWNTGKWNDFGCKYEVPYICQKFL